MVEYFMENPSMRKHMMSVVEEERRLNNDIEIINAVDKMIADIDSMFTQEA